MLHIIDLNYRLPRFLNRRCFIYQYSMYIEGVYRPFPVWIISDSAPVSLGALQVNYIVHKTFLILSCIIFRLCDPKTRCLSNAEGVHNLNLQYQDFTRTSFFCHELLTKLLAVCPCSLRLLSYCLFLVSHSLHWHCSPTELYFHYFTVSKQLLLIHNPGNLLWRCVVKLVEHGTNNGIIMVSIHQILQGFCLFVLVSLLIKIFSNVASIFDVIHIHSYP